MPVFTGVWYDHFSSKLVLTTDATSGGFLTAAVVIWVNLVATMTWPIFRYVLYTMSMKQRANLDVFYHQRQTTLRNSRSPTSTAAQLARLAWRWKSYRHRSILARSAPAALVCICISLAWVLCGLYAPYIYTKTGSDVLLTASDHCGLVGAGQGFEQNSAQVNNLLTAGQMAAVKAAETYAEQCYQTDGNTSLSSCGTYPQKQLNFTTGTAVCPFGDGSPCQTTNSTVVTFDTGLLDSSNDFGVNAPRYESIQYRRLTTCATVHTAGYVTVFNASNGPDASKYPPGSVFLRYDYGPLGGSNWTWEYSELWDSVPYPYYLTYDPTTGRNRIGDDTDILPARSITAPACRLLTSHTFPTRPFSTVPTPICCWCSSRAMPFTTQNLYMTRYLLLVSLHRTSGQ